MNSGDPKSLARRVPEIHDLVVTFANSIGMVPILLAKEQNGYVMNSLSMPWMMAGLR